MKRHEAKFLLFFTLFITYISFVGGCGKKSSSEVRLSEQSQTALGANGRPASAIIRTNPTNGAAWFLKATPPKRLHIEITQDYAVAGNIDLPFHFDIVELLKPAGWLEVASTNPCDGTLTIKMSGLPLGATYSQGGFLYTAASIEGTISFVTESNITLFTKHFYGEVPPPSDYFIRADEVDLPQKAQQAPFGEVYNKFILPELVDAFVEAFGTKFAVHAFCEESFRSNILQRKSKKGDDSYDLSEALAGAVKKIGKPTVVYLRRVESQIKLDMPKYNPNDFGMIWDQTNKKYINDEIGETIYYSDESVLSSVQYIIKAIESENVPAP